MPAIIEFCSPCWFSLWVLLATVPTVGVTMGRGAGFLDALAQTQEGRSRRATSTMRAGELRPGTRDRVVEATAEPKGDLEEASNWDNFRIAPGATHVLMDEQGPGVITHIWLTFLGPEPQDWARQGSANHQEMLLRMYFDQWGIVGGHTSAYRWHVPDPIVFERGIKVSFEHFGWISPDENPEYQSHSWNEREDDFASVAFWYQTGESTFEARAPRVREMAHDRDQDWRNEPKLYR